MIPTANDNTQVENTLTGESGRFELDPEATAHIMDMLSTNLYGDPEGAATREYSTNALDSQVEAQEADPDYLWRPVEITTPSHFNKSYKIRDFGVGMDVEDIKRVYSKYGKSTKRGTNTQNGMLGLGSKSALTYTSQFTLVGFKHGMKTTALISRDEEGFPTFHIIDTRATDEPNGVEINIPVKDRNSFYAKTMDFVKYWKDGQVLVDGKEPAKHGLTKVADQLINWTIKGVEQVSTAEVFLLEGGTSWNRVQSKVVMGNVAYPVDDNYVDQALLGAGMGFVAYVPIGSVNFPANRESLYYNDNTKRIIQQISKGLFEKILDEKLKRITDAPNHKDAWAVYSALPQHFKLHQKTGDFLYKGAKVASSVRHSHMFLTWNYVGHGEVSERDLIEIRTAMSGLLVVTGVNQDKKPHATFKKKVRHYLVENNIPTSGALLVGADVDSPWLAWLPRIDAETIKAIKLPRDTDPADPRVEAKYDYSWMDGKDYKAGTELIVPVPAGRKLVYISPTDMRETYRKSGTTAYELVKAIGDSIVLVVLAKNRFTKFLRTHPTAIHLSKVVQDRIDALVAQSTGAEYIVSKLTYSQLSFMRAVDVTKIADKDLIDVAKIVQGTGQTSQYNKAKGLHDIGKRAGINTTLPPMKTATTTNVLTRYPLINTGGSANHMDDMIVYLNAKYNQQYRFSKPVTKP